MQIFSVEFSGKIFKVIGIADVFRKTTKFQAVVNNVPFAQDEDYQVVRTFLMDAIELNQPSKHEGVV